MIKSFPASLQILEISLLRCEVDTVLGNLQISQCCLRIINLYDVKKETYLEIILKRLKEYVKMKESLKRVGIIGRKSLKTRPEDVVDYFNLQFFEPEELSIHSPFYDPIFNLV